MMLFAQKRKSFRMLMVAFEIYWQHQGLVLHFSGEVEIAKEGHELNPFGNIRAKVYTTNLINV